MPRGQRHPAPRRHGMDKNIPLNLPPFHRRRANKNTPCLFSLSLILASRCRYAYIRI